jgi:hypothetical protein
VFAGCQIRVNSAEKTAVINLNFDKIKLTQIRQPATNFPQNSSSSSSHASIEETGRTVSSPSRRDSRSREPAPSRPSGLNKFPAATAGRGSATAAIFSRGSHSTKIEVLRLNRSQLHYMWTNNHHIHTRSTLYLIRLKRSWLPRVLITLKSAWCWVSAEDNWVATDARLADTKPLCAT